MDAWKIYVDTWKVSKKEEKVFENIYKDITLFQIAFPEFWQMAYKNKNNFFQHVFVEAKQHFVEAQKYDDQKLWINEKYIEEDRCKELWHRHCDFCMKTITTEIPQECYCSEDLEFWICAKCFNNFKDHFKWIVKIIEDIPINTINNIIEIKIANK